MSAATITELLPVADRPTRHLRVITDDEAQRLGREIAARHAASKSASRTQLTNRSDSVSRREAEATLSGTADQIVLTERGVKVVRAAIATLFAVIGIALAIVAGSFIGLALSGPGPQAGETIVVGSGDNLWQIASSVALPGQDVREVISQIAILNSLDGHEIFAGQSLVLPAQP